MLKLGKNHGLVGDIDANIKRIKEKTLSYFFELLCYATSIKLKRKIITMYIEPIIDYALVTIILAPPNETEKIVREFDQLQAMYLRKAAGVGTYVSNDELHRIFKIKTIREKVHRLSFNEWSKIDFARGYEPKPILTRSRKRSGDTERILDRMYKFKIEHEKTMLNKAKTSENKFDKKKFWKWKKDQDKKLAKILRKNQDGKEMRERMMSQRHEIINSALRKIEEESNLTAR